MTSLHLNQHRRLHLDSNPLCSFDQLKRHPVTQNDLSDWCRTSSPSLVTLTKSSPPQAVCLEREHEALPHVALVPQVDPPNDTQLIRSPGIYLDDSDADADDERPPSPTTSFTDEFSENDTSVRGGCLAVNSTASYQTTDHAEFIAPSLTRSTSIRFRSRVRITSGLHRHRRSAAGSSTKGLRGKENSIHLTDDDGGRRVTTAPSPPLSSSSSSSSLSAPLRSRSDDEAERPGWAPLGQRVGMFTRKNRRNKQVDGQIWANSLAAFPAQVGGAETTPLLVPAYRAKPRSPQHRRKGRRQYDDDYYSPHRSLSPEEVDEAFGKWPDRLLNYQWWWWFTEAVICCRCLDETDDEFSL